MKTKVVFLFFLLVSGIAVADEWWSRAVASYEENRDWVAGRTDILTEEFGRRGQLRNTERRSYLTSTDSPGASRLIYAEKNGEDITAQELAKSAAAREAERKSANDDESDRSGDSGGAASLPNPFDPTLQDRVTYTRVSGSESGSDGARVAYDFRLVLNDESAYIGTAYFDPTTGVPVAVEASMETLPALAEFVRLEVEFENDASRWYAKRVTFEGAGGLLFVYRRVRSTLDFSEYARAR
jgi:hypothetical protein